MKRNRPDKALRRGISLGDTLSSSVRDELYQLHNTLKEQAQKTIERQMGEAQPPWRRRVHSQFHQPARPASRGIQITPHVGDIRRSRTPAPNISITRKPPQRPKPMSDSPRSTFELWPFPNEAMVREPPPHFISKSDKDRLEIHLKAGVAPWDDTGEILFIIIGLDFGTSSTKVIVRLPYEPGEPTIAIPAPSPCRSAEDAYLWQTVLWIQTDEVFAPWPEPDAVVLSSIKQGLIQGRAKTRIATSIPLEITRNDAGVAYLAFVIRYVMGWIRSNRADYFRGRRPVWFVNVGMPTASHDDLQITKPYRRIAAAALQLAKVDSPITLKAVKLFFENSHVVKAGNFETDAEALGVAVLPEAAAEMTGFAKSARNAPGLYFLVDVGAMTFDVCMFRLNQNVSEPDHYAFMAAQVRPLGVDSFHWFHAEGKTEEEFICQCQYTLRSVVWETKSNRDPNADTWKSGNDLPVFLAGGGAANPLHQDVVNSLGPWLKRYVHNEGIRPLNLSSPKTIDLPEPLADFGRMAVAWGLSYLPTDIGRIHPISSFSDIEHPEVVGLCSPIITKDQV